MGLMKSEKKLDIEKIRKDFPLLKRKIHGKPVVYFDNASTTQKPEVVIKTLERFYRKHNANVHRGIYQLSEESTLLFEEARKKIAEFINASTEEVIFTRGTTESLNLVAYSLGSRLQPLDEILITQMEHHSNFVPWQQIAQKMKCVLKFIDIDYDGRLKLDQLAEKITKKTKIVSFVHVSNALGTVNPVKEMIQKIRQLNPATIVIVDGAQAVPHRKVNVKELDSDFYAFSGHKMLGPTGIGILYGKRELLEKLPPFLYGGNMIREVTFTETTFNELPWKFEAGTPNIADAIALGAAIDYLNGLGLETIEQHEIQLIRYAWQKLQKIKGITLYGPAPSEKGDQSDHAGVISFTLKSIHPHDLSSVLDDYGIAIRGGHHCAMPLMSVLGVNGTARLSFYLYNTVQEIDYFIDCLEKAHKVLS